MGDEVGSGLSLLIGSRSIEEEVDVCIKNLLREDLNYTTVDDELRKSLTTEEDSHELFWILTSGRKLYVKSIELLGEVRLEMLVDT